MVASDKLYEQLQQLEVELHKKIVPHLEQAAAGNNNLVFCVKNFNPYRKFKEKTDNNTEYLVELGSQILTLKKKLGESSKDSIAEKICWYCREWGDCVKTDPNCAQKLAKQFLTEIEKQVDENA